jgi:hypothetical protein
MPLVFEIFLRATGWPTLSDSTSVEYQYSFCSFVVAVTRTSVVQVAQSNGVVVVNGQLIGKGDKGSCLELTCGFIQCVSGGMRVKQTSVNTVGVPTEIHKHYFLTL